MAGYFSNHSQSRFLANSNAASQTTTTTTAAAAAAASAAAPGGAAAAAGTGSGTPQGVGAARPRVPSSKHFSTFVSTAAGDEKASGKDKAAGNGASNGSASVHPLRNTYVRTLLCAHVTGI